MNQRILRQELFTNSMRWSFILLPHENAILQGSISKTVNPNDFMLMDNLMFVMLKLQNCVLEQQNRLYLGR